MAVQSNLSLGRFVLSPAIILLFLWMIVPLGISIYFSFLRFNLLDAENISYFGFSNYAYFLTDEAFITAFLNTLTLVFSILCITVIGGIGLAVLLNCDFWGRGAVRLMVISPFFVMPPVSALIWKNLLMNPVSGFFAWIQTIFGLTPIDWFSQIPLFSIILLISWQWLPFATLILLTSMQSLDSEQKEAAFMDGANSFSMFFWIILPHLSRAIAIVILIETIFLLSIFAEIFITTGGGPGLATTNIAFLIFAQALLQFDIGGASAGGVVAVILANIVAFFLIKTIASNLNQT
jgi:sorbitol/mannitol transport system permease protein